MSEELTAPETGAETTVAPTPDLTLTGGGGDAVNSDAEAAPSAEEQQPENKGKERLSVRFSELTGQRDAANARADQEAEARQRAERELEALRQQAPQAQDYSQDGYDDDAVPLTKAQIAALVKAEVESREQEAARQSTQKAFGEKVESLRAKLLDSGLEGAVTAATGNGIRVTSAMINVLSANEQAPQVIDHLSRNPAEANRIADLPPELIGYELAGLSARLASQPKTTNAPEPPSTVGARGTPGTGLRDDMPIDDWMKAERARVEARQR